MSPLVLLLPPPPAVPSTPRPSRARAATAHPARHSCLSSSHCSGSDGAASSGARPLRRRPHGSPAATVGRRLVVALRHRATRASSPPPPSSPSLPPPPLAPPLPVASVMLRTPSPATIDDRLTLALSHEATQSSIGRAAKAKGVLYTPGRLPSGHLPSGGGDVTPQQPPVEANPHNSPTQHQHPVREDGVAEAGGCGSCVKIAASVRWPRASSDASPSSV